MIWGILLYYLWIVISLYLSYVLLYRTYEEDDERVNFPLWLHIVAFIVSFVPGLNILSTVGIIVFMFAIATDEDVTFKTILFKKI